MRRNALKIDVVAMRQAAIYRSEAETIYVEKAYDSLIWQGPQAKPVRPDGTRNHRPRGSTSMVADCWSIVENMRKRELREEDVWKS